MRGIRKGSILVAALVLTGGWAVAKERPIPRGATIFIQEMPEDLHMYLKAEIVKKKVPVRIVENPDQAQFILHGTAEGNEERKWHEGWLTAERDKFTGAVQIVDVDGNFIWASEAGDRSLWWGALKRGGPRRVADRLANNLKKIVEK